MIVKNRTGFVDFKSLKISNKTALWDGRRVQNPPSGMTHHHHGLVLGNLRKLFGRHPLGPFRPFGRQSSRVQELFDGGCLDTEVYVLRH